MIFDFSYTNLIESSKLTLNDFAKHTSTPFKSLFNSRTWLFIEKVSGINHFKIGVNKFRNENKNNGLSHCLLGTAQAAAIVALSIIATQAILYYLDESGDTQNFHNDICQFSSTKHLCEGNFGILRKDMPQVEGEVKQKILNLFSSANSTQIEAELLTPIQSEMNLNKVTEMVKAAHAKVFNACESEILVAEDHLGRHFVVDGHHRYATCRLLKGIQKIVKIKYEPREFINFLLKFPGVFTINLEEFAD